MASSEQMRAAWSRRTDEELLRAFFLEDLSTDGRHVVTQLVAEKVGDIDAYVRAFEIEQGEILAGFVVGGFDADVELKQMSLPLMWGELVLAANGLGFVPGGRDDDPGGESVGTRLGMLGAGPVGGLLGAIGASVWSGLKGTAHHVEYLAGTSFPLPLLAMIDSNAIWLPHGSFDSLLWGPDFGEVVRAGERLFCAEPAEDVESVVRDWAARHRIPVAAIEPAPLLR